MTPEQLITFSSIELVGSASLTDGTYIAIYKGDVTYLELDNWYGVWKFSTVDHTGAHDRHTIVRRGISFVDGATVTNFRYYLPILKALVTNFDFEPLESILEQF